MRTPSTRLAPIRHVADNREQEAARLLVQRQQAVTQAQAKLVELRRYLREYQQQETRSQQISQLLNRQAFVKKLEEAEGFQTRAVEAAQKVCEEQRLRWLLCRRDVQTYQKLHTVYQTREHAADERRDQKLMDEFAQRLPRDRHE